MTRLIKLLPLSILALGFSVPFDAFAAQVDSMACYVSVTYSLNNVPSLNYAMNFQLNPDQPFSDDFSTPTRFRFFDAVMTVEAGIPVVSINFDADVGVFSALDFNASLKVRDKNAGETTSGDNTFFNSAFGANATHRTSYTLTCQRAKI